MSVPVALLWPHVERYLAEFPEREWSGTTQDYMSGPEALANAAGVSRDLIYKMRYGKSSISFDTADKLLCAMGNVFLWYQGELAEIYWSHRLLENKAPSGKCEHCAGSLPENSRPERRFCSKLCKERSYYKRLRDTEFGQRQAERQAALRRARRNRRAA